jgi:hypothetical protein
MIAALVVAGLALAAAAYILRPLLDGPRIEAPSSDQAVEELHELKRAALMAIIDIEAERDVGKLSDEDFEVLKRQYGAEAVRALHQLDELGATQHDRDAELEAEIARIRETMTCPACGAIRDPGRPCPECGSG